jgi:sugar phosphate isomerase/epimerase
MILNAATAMFPGDTYLDAMEKLSTGHVSDAGFPVSLSQVQLCPQNHGVLSKELLGQLQELYPNTVFRLHATCRLAINGYRRYEASTPLHVSRAYFKELADLSAAIDAPVYSLHAGRRAEATLGEVIRNVALLQDIFQCPVAIEGLYPTRGDTLLMSTWDEYRTLMESGLYYALDMSHLNIVSTHQRKWDTGLVMALLEHPNCLEIHVSSNNGRSDTHLPLIEDALPVWWADLQHAGPNAVIFTESNQRGHERTKEII